ncbi:kinetochore protein Spc24-like isoform X2 [Dreissena polymorpha]|uniref:Kinetochore protein Spc24 n=2 Tax=Dreissena polymorpha TaxID=45954 RepID=A0A9D4LT37_DREPO|nr:kinetochore protein Spc24-like isoform X2 [Dreissena polymorpha]KAH3863284.1 hypothetical protein DPMN_026265 [Dreissena polymorpha]
MTEVEELLYVTEEFNGQLEINKKKARKQIDDIRQRAIRLSKVWKKLEDMVKSETAELASEKDGTFKVKLVQEGEQLRSDIAAVKKHQTELSSRIREKESLRNELSEKQVRLQVEKERIENDTRVQIPIKRETIALYTCVSKIRWDFEGSSDEIKGYINNKTAVKPFCFDKRKASQFFISNALWDTMEEN